MNQEEFGCKIATVIHEVFIDEIENNELEKMDATEYITAMIKACNVVFGIVTRTCMDNLEFTHLCNKLIVQDMIQDKNLRIIDKEE